MSASPILELDAIISDATKSRLDFDEDVFRQHVLDHLGTLAEGSTFAIELNALTDEAKEKIIAALKETKAFRVQVQERSATYGALVKVSQSLLGGINEVDLLIRNYSSAITEKLQSLMEVAQVLSVPLPDRIPDSTRAIQSHDYSGVRTVFKEIEAAERKLDSAVRQIFTKEGWPESMVGLFRKIRAGTSLKDLTDEEWKLLGSIKAKPLGSKIRLGVGSS